MLLCQSVRLVLAIAMSSSAIASAVCGLLTPAQARSLILQAAPSSHPNVTLTIAQSEAGEMGEMGEASLAQALILIQQGMSQVNTGELESAVQYFDQALGVSREMGDPYLEGLSLIARGRALLGLEQSEPGLESVQQGLAIAQELGDSQLEALAQGILNEAEAP
ncbi:MAG: hypothetical protein WBA57_03640 [Elainellaceae cyanobacterium]